MKRTFRNLSSLLLALVMVLSMSVTAFAADSTIIFKGAQEGFDFQPVSEYTATDLFDNFKDVMPGDTLTETIQVKNEATDCDYIKLYMRAVVHDESGNPLTYSEVFENTDGKDQANVAGQRDETVATMQDFLSQLTMRIYNGEELIYDASPDEAGALVNNVLLGTLSTGESLTLKVELDVPIELGNEYANRVGEVDWVFKTEALDDPEPETNEPEPDNPQPEESQPEEPSTPEIPDLLSPKTGDTSNLLIYIVIASAAVIGLIFHVIFGRRKDSEEK